MRAVLGMLAALMVAAPSWASRPEDGAYGLQEAATPIMSEINDFHTMVQIIITAVTLFVVALLLWVMVRYNSRMNPTPRKFSHNTLVEVIWTGVPVLILIVIAVPSFKLLYNQETIPDGVRVYNGEVIPAAELTIKATGVQWYWEYEYPDNGGFSYASYLLPAEEAPPGDYLLAVDAPFVAPEDTTVRLVVTAADVIHNWAMPAFGIKIDAVPGRLNEVWFRVEEPGTYYGQCSELCGRDHAFMPIQVEIVSRAAFDAWSAAMVNGDDSQAAAVLAEYKTELAGATRLAALQ